MGVKGFTVLGLAGDMSKCRGLGFRLREDYLYIQGLGYVTEMETPIETRLEDEAYTWLISGFLVWSTSKPNQVNIKYMYIPGIYRNMQDL